MGARGKILTSTYGMKLKLGPVIVFDKKRRYESRYSRMNLEEFAEDSL